jgi:hypothetical protein
MADRLAHASPRKPVKRTIPTKAESWRRYDDSYPAFNRPPSAQSLNPDAGLIHAYAEGYSRARAIINAWQPSLVYGSLIVTAELPQ